MNSKGDLMFQLWAIVANDQKLIQANKGTTKLQQSGFVIRAIMVNLGPNLIFLNYKVGT
jgi:hypothetical protein